MKMFFIFSFKKINNGKTTKGRTLIFGKYTHTIHINISKKNHTTNNNHSILIGKNLINPEIIVFSQLRSSNFYQ